MNFEAYAYNKYQFANSISAALEMYPTRDVIVIVELPSVSSCMADVLERFPSAKRTQVNRLKIGKRMVTFLEKFDSRIMGFDRHKTVLVNIWKHA